MTNSKVPRDTKKLVAGVGQKKTDVSTVFNLLLTQKVLSEGLTIGYIPQEPELVHSILEAIQSISDEARRALADPELPRDSLLSALSVSYTLTADLSVVLRFLTFC